MERLSIKLCQTRYYQAFHILDIIILAQSSLVNFMIGSISPSLVFNQADIDDLKSFYQFRRENDIVQFLATHPHLLPILLSGKDLIRQYLAGANIFIDCIVDPELAETQLVVCLTRTIEDSEAAIEEIEKLYDAWLGGYNSDIRSQIYIRYDYL